MSRSRSSNAIVGLFLKTRRSSGAIHIHGRISSVRSSIRSSVHEEDSLLGSTSLLLLMMLLSHSVGVNGDTRHKDGSTNVHGTRDILGVFRDYSRLLLLLGLAAKEHVSHDGSLLFLLWRC